MSSDFKDLMLAAFPLESWNTIVRGEREGIALADDVRKNTPMLNTPLGMDLRGHLRRLGVMFRLEQLCRAGDLPFQAEIDHMRYGTWHWLNLRSGKFLGHMARTDTFSEIPEDTRNRQDYRLHNEPDLFADKKIVPIHELADQVDRFYAYLTFGADPVGKLTHSGLGMASPDNSSWLALENLIRRADEQPAGVPRSPSPVDPKERIKFLEHVEEIIAEGDVAAEDGKKK